MKAVPAGWWFAAAFACLPGPLLRAQRQHLVTVHVAAQDSMGEPIPDLRAPDLRVFDNGKPRGIALFHRSDPRPLVDPLAPNEYTNRPKAPLPHTLVILLDLLNEPLLTGSSFRQDLVNVLGHLESAEGIYLYVLTNHGDMYPIHGLGSTEPSWRIQAGPTLDKVLRRNSGFRFGYADYGVRSMITWPRLSQLASTLAPVPGRKTLLWITRGMPYPMDPKRPEALHLALAMREAGVIVYPLDPLALGADPLDDAARHDVLRKVAGMTGGRSYFAESIGDALHRALADARGSYEIGFYSPDEGWDGKYHKIRVSTSRARANLLSETGYFAAAPATLEDAIAGHIDTSTIGIRATVTAGGGSGVAHVQLRIEAEDVAFSPTLDRLQGRLTLTLAGFDAGPSALLSAPAPPPAQASGPLSIDLNLTQQDYVAALKTGIRFAADFPVGDRERTLWLVVREPSSGRCGAVLTPWDAVRRD